MKGENTCLHTFPFHRIQSQLLNVFDRVLDVRLQITDWITNWITELGVERMANTPDSTADVRNTPLEMPKRIKQGWGRLGWMLWNSQSSLKCFSHLENVNVKT